MKLAEMTGDLPETCSYHRLHVGMAEGVKKVIQVNEQAILPLPDLMVASRACTEMSHYAEALYRRMGIRMVPIDFPITFRREDIPRTKEYVHRQIKEILIPTLEEVCGKPFDYDRMSEILSILKKTATIRNQCWEFLKTRPATWTL